MTHMHSGENHQSSKLKVEDVRAIQHELKTNPYRGLQTELASKYGVSKTVITMIKKGVIWRRQAPLARPIE